MINLKAKDIANILVRCYGPCSLRASRAKFIMENVSFGLFRWGEVDLLVCSKSGYLTDIEIKTSISDLKADFRKKKWIDPYYRRDVKYHYYAIPEQLKDKAIELIEENQPKSGIILVKHELVDKGGVSDYYSDNAWCIKNAKMSKEARALRDKDFINLARLAMFRYWRNNR